MIIGRATMKYTIKWIETHPNLALDNQLSDSEVLADNFCFATNIFKVTYFICIVLILSDV